LTKCVSSDHFVDLRPRLALAIDEMVALARI